MYYCDIIVQGGSNGSRGGGAESPLAHLTLTTPLAVCVYVCLCLYYCVWPSPAN